MRRIFSGMVGIRGIGHRHWTPGIGDLPQFARSRVHNRLVIHCDTLVRARTCASSDRFREKGPAKPEHSIYAVRFTIAQPFAKLAARRASWLVGGLADWRRIVAAHLDQAAPGRRRIRSRPHSGRIRGSNYGWL